MMVSIAASSRLDLLDNGFNFFGLAVEFSKGVSENHVSLSHVIESFISILILEKHEGECEFTFSCLDILFTILYLEEVHYSSKMLLSFLIIVSIDGSVCIVVHHRSSEVFLYDKFPPNLHYL